MVSITAFTSRVGSTSIEQDLSGRARTAVTTSDIPNFNELCADYTHFTRFYSDGSKMGDGVASAVVW